MQTMKIQATLEIEVSFVNEEEKAQFLTDLQIAKYGIYDELNKNYLMNELRIKNPLVVSELA